MKRSWSFIFYTLLLATFAVLIVWLLYKGHSWSEATSISTLQNGSPELLDGFFHPLAILVLQIITVILVAKGVGYFTDKIGQPSVVGEILAGIVLGPSILGALSPLLSGFLFPESSLDNLQLFSQFGLILFMFIIGMELDVKMLRNQARAAVVVSHAGIFIPFSLGICLAYFLYTDFAPSGISFVSFALFMGIAMSITAFPVLARIIQERGLSKTNLGTMAITCAAADDVTAWCLLAAVIAIVKAGSILSALYTVILATAFVIGMITLVQPLMKKVGSVYASREIFNRKVVALILLVLLGSSYLAEVIGIHALFGAFLAGVIMPQNLAFKKIISEKIEDLSIVLLLPLFFVFTGLRTEIGLLNDGLAWMIFVFILLIAVIGKFGGVSLSARLVGQSWKDALSLGTLMNTRGLMEIVVLNIGYDLGILSPTIFTMLVLMTIVTTFLTGPGLNFIDRVFAKTDFGEQVLARIRTSFRVFISFGPPKMGSTLLRLADQLTLNQNKNVEVSALHITPSNDVKPYEAVLYEKEGFQPIRSTAQLLGIKLKTIYRNTEDVDKEIVSHATYGDYDLVLVGAARPMFNDRTTGGRLKQLLEDGEMNVGVLVDRGFVMAESILLLLGSEDDLSLLQYAYRFRQSNRARVTILKTGDGQSIDQHNRELPYHELFTHFNEVIEQRIPDKQLLSHYNLILVSLELWDELNRARATWIKDCPSILVVNHHRDLAVDEVPSQIVESKDTDGRSFSE